MAMFIEQNNNNTLGRRSMRGFTLLEIFVVLLVIGFLALVAMPTCPPSVVRSRVSRVKADHRSIAIGLEAYFVDQASYPDTGAETIWRRAELEDDAKGTSLTGEQLPTILSSSDPDHPFRKYITPTFFDPFGTEAAAPYCYWPVTGYSEEGKALPGWIIWSAGPDGDYDLTLANIAEAYKPAERVPNDILINLAYDPTNGSVSSGDVYRTKQ